MKNQITAAEILKCSGEAEVYETPDGNKVYLAGSFFEVESAREKGNERAMIEWNVERAKDEIAMAGCCS